MKFIEYCCYYLFNFLLKKGKSYGIAKTAAVMYISLSIFFFCLSGILFLRFTDFAINKIIFRSIGLAFAILFYIFMYFKVEREHNFKKILERYEKLDFEPYSKFVVWAFVLGGFIFFCLSIVIIAIISQN